jgi:UDP:flavonoid glycosyltransferase YjiC (YdhE family)
VRALFASTRGTGHLNPLIPFIDACRRGGHETLVAGPPDLAEAVEQAGFPYSRCDPPPEEVLGPTWGRVQSAASVEEGEAIVVGEIFGRLNVEAALPRMSAACEEWEPDVILHEPAEYASAIAAEEFGIPHARVAIGLFSSEREMTEIASPALEATSPGITQAIADSPYLSLFPESLEEPATADLPARRFRDPAADDAPGALGDWWAADERPLVYLSFGSVAGGLPAAPAIYGSALEAVADVPARILVTTGRSLDLEALEPAPENAHLAPWVPQADALAEADLVVCHGGSGTTLGSLAAGLPLVIVPLFADQPPNARRVADVGAGLVVEPLREGPTKALPSSIDPGSLREAILTALDSAALASGAQAIADEMGRLPDTDAALEVLAELCGSG